MYYNKYLKYKNKYHRYLNYITKYGGTINNNTSIEFEDYTNEQNPTINIYNFTILNNINPDNSINLSTNLDKNSEGSFNFNKINKRLFSINDDLSINESYIKNYENQKVSKDYLNIKYSKIYKLNPKISAQEINSDIINYNNEEKEEFINNLITVIKIKEKILGDFLKKNNNLIDKNCDNYGFIQKITINPNDKVIIFGDYHGSFHTFFRNMIRLHLAKVLNLDSLEIYDNYKIIFLGDIVDRGAYSLEILNLIFLLMIKNENSIFINRGNHEVHDIYSKYGFTNEIYVKCDNNKDYLNNIHHLFNLCSTAIVLIDLSNDVKYWLCHGCIPCNNDDIDEQIFNFISKKNNEEFLLLEQSLTEKIPGVVTQIRWNDASIDKHGIAVIDENPIYNNIRGSFIVNKKQFKKYLDKFDFIIRAHQDSYFNAWLLGNEKSFQVGKQIYNSDTNIISTIKKPQYQDGPILRININNTDWITKNNYLKVLTISTNTGYGRNLYNDSFIVISTNNNTINNVLESNLQNNELNWIIEKNWKIK
jgi:hypothetical protein